LVRASCAWHDSFTCVWHDSFKRHVHMCNMTCSNNTYLCVTWLLVAGPAVCDMTCSKDIFIWVTWRLQMTHSHVCDMTRAHVCDMTRSNDTFICVTWRVRITHTYWSALGKLKFERAQVSFGVCKQKESQQTNSGKIEFIWTPSAHSSGIFKWRPYTWNLILETPRGCSGNKVWQKTFFENSGRQSGSNDVFW